MYIPKHFKVTAIDEIEEFITKYSFGTLVTTKKSRPIATHLPLYLEKDVDGHYYMTGHLAFGNPQWRTFEESEEVLVMFQGPHAYISSSWYNHENVPTWNYQAVHIYGKAETVTKEELINGLKKLLNKYEGHRENPILWEKLSPDLLETELKGIVGFKIKVREVQAAYKLSQNRDEEDKKNIIGKLYEEADVNSHQLAEAMMKSCKYMD
ncbi:FMN-binding negative transcriptional regulator [Shimazuella alba]|uniref:FMN-binding negative transcriptional regulator n=1 Tax=Shimazuella alba TaxID=2690964 RepID=A0A6I4VXD6_9BACL|nr:FMN-binding negative transcriptional regulator [Shimazuella alba]MXQ55248.1 FMN-binding negative transcriptional regulator [Shimazuella alba]